VGGVRSSPKPVGGSLGTGDMRTLYGMGVPFVVMTFLIIAALVLEAV
jgi:hypothetical protein